MWIEAKLEYIAEFKCLLNKSTTKAKFCRKVVNGRKIPDAVRSLVNGKSLKLNVEGCCLKACSVSFNVWDF